MVVRCNPIHIGVRLTAFRWFDIERIEGKGIKGEI